MGRHSAGSRRGQVGGGRRLVFRLEALETRELLSTVPAAWQSMVPVRAPEPVPVPGSAVQQMVPQYDFYPLFSGSPPAGALTPSQVQTAYGFNKITFGSVKGDGTGQTIAIVDSYDDPNIQADLNAFCTQYGLPSTTVTRVGQTGGAVPGVDTTGGWELEIALDVEWAHAMAPGANILLVEASSPSSTNLLAAVDYGAAHASVVSMSWGGGEFSTEASATNEKHFMRAGVTFVASSGDAGAPASWPAVSPNVVAVGGTALTVSATGGYTSETGWSGSGGGPSLYESKPAYQSGVVTQTSTARANPDVAYDASPSTGFAVYDTYPYNGSNLGWLTVGGTSAGAPQWAALVAIANQGRSLSAQAALNSASSQEVLSTLYKNASTAFHDITTGSSTGTPNYGAGAGYDYVTGIGSPVANLVVQALAGTVTAQSDHLVVTGATTSVAGTALSVTVSAQTAAGVTDSAYTGTVALTSTDSQAGLPAAYSFTAADAGTHTFSITLKTSGTQSVTATDSLATAAAGALSGVVVSPAPASQFVLSGLPATAVVGAGQSVIVTARDPYGNLATGYTGTVSFTSSDAAAVLPANYTFVAGDAGIHTFSVTFQTAGTQSVTITDTVTGTLTASQTGISVSPTAPLSLTAAAASNTQINLNWTGVAGASAYLVERSANGTTGWAQIASVTTTLYSDTALQAGTTYYYRLRATVNGVNSGYSAVVSALTTGTAPVTSLWPNSYVPPEDAYSWGSYELGAKIKTDVAGTVSALRFYKQSWMDGYTHIGHLWSSTGTLLATALYTGETLSGWQQVSLTTPVSLLASTVYIVSFSSGGGYFGINTTGFSTSGVDNGVLHALPNSTPGGDGVYRSGTGVFPNKSGNGMNFYADLVFNSITGKVVLGGGSFQGGPGGFTQKASNPGGGSGSFDVSIPPTTGNQGVSTGAGTGTSSGASAVPSVTPFWRVPGQFQNQARVKYAAVPSSTKPWLQF